MRRSGGVGYSAATRASISRTSSISIYLDCRVQKDLRQNVLLRMTAAELVHLVKDRFHEIDGTSIFTLPMRQHCLGYR